jgi:signal transduction histidine kinase
MKGRLRRAVLLYGFACCITLLSLYSCNKLSSNEHIRRDSLLAVQGLNVVTLKVDSGLYLEVKPYLDSFYATNNIVSYQSLSYKYEKLAAVYYFQLFDTATTIKYLDSMSMLIKKGYELEPDMMMSWYFYNGHVSTEGKRFDEAFRFYYRGKLIVDSLESGCGNVRYYHTLAMILFRQHKYGESKDYFRKCYEYAARCNTEDSVLVVSAQRNALSNIGICCENLFQYDSAVYYYDKCMNLIESNVHLFEKKKLALQTFIGLLHGNKGGVLVKLKRYDEAEAALKYGIKLNYRREGEMGDAVLSKIKLAGLYLQTGRNKECLALIKELEVDTRKIPYLYYKQVKDYIHAYKSLAEYHQYKEAMEANTNYNILTSADHIKEFEVMERRFELGMLKRNNEIKNRYLFLSVAMVAMALVILVLLLVRRKASKAHIEELTLLNKRVQRSNEKLQQSLQSLQQSQEENTKIMKIVAHDLRSPIAGIMGLVRLIKVDDLTREELNEYIDLVEKSGNNALAFIEDLLYINKAQQPFDTEETDVQQLLEWCVNIMQVQATRKNQHIRLQAVPLIIRVNEEKIWRVINNIISNAIKFSPIGTTINVNMQVKEHSVLISVKDEGMGIPDSLKDKMFSTFSGAGRPGTGGEQSYGLGLAIAKQIIDAHKGRIWFESTVGKGTTFFVELPVAQN